MIRGGGWADNAQYARSAQRDYDRPEDRGNDVGFRVVRIGDSEKRDALSMFGVSSSLPSAGGN